MSITFHVDEKEERENTINHEQSRKLLHDSTKMMQASRY